MGTMKQHLNQHWTSRSMEDFVYRISSDFVLQVEQKMEEERMSQKDLAERLRVSDSRVSQVLRNPGNLTLKKIVEYARVLGLKVSIVAYDDGDPQNKNGPINSQVFNLCWMRAGAPRDFFALSNFTSDVRPLGPISQIHVGDYRLDYSHTQANWMAIPCDPTRSFRLSTSADKVTRLIKERVSI